MDLVEFRGTIYGKYQTQLYVFEPTWDSFRPITRVVWNGEKIVVDDVKYKTNLFSPIYGYESYEQKEMCKKLIDSVELDSAKPIVDIWKWYRETDMKWWRDRPCVFLNECVSQDAIDWKRYLQYLNSRPKTLRNRIRVKKTTRRLVPK